MTTRMLTALCGALTLLCVTAWAAPMAKPSYDQSPFAINALGLMFVRDKPDWAALTKEATSLKAAGIHWARFDFWWGVVEPEKDKFDWTFSDEMAKFYKDNGINGMPILCYSSAWYRKPPDNDEERARFANYVFHVVDRYKGTFKAWEVWNEPNITTFWNPPNVRDYTLMLIEAYKAAKKADPDCVIVGGAVNGPGYDFIQGMYENGGFDYCDAISIHPYSLGGPPLAQRYDRWLRLQNSEIAKTGKPKPVWVTEVGYASAKPEEELGQATAIVQANIISLANGVQKYFYFNYANYGNWGITYGDPSKPKISYGAYRLMTQALGSPGQCAAFEGYLKSPRELAAYVFKKRGDSRVLFLWSNDEKTRPYVLAQTKGLKAVDIAGNQIPIANGSLQVGPTPIIVTGADARQIGQVSKDFNPFLEAKNENLLLNPSFEQGKDGSAGYWNIGRFYSKDKDGKFAWTNDGRNATKCLSISQSGDPCACDSYPIPAAPGQKYKLTGWVKTQDATGRNILAILWYNGTQWHVISPSTKTMTITGTTDWKKFTIEGIAPVGTAQIRVNLISENNKGTIWFDDVTLTEE